LPWDPQGLSSRAVPLALNWTSTFAEELQLLPMPLLMVTPDDSVVQS
jgi:hypothetical protein